jgi:hypothetical protein
VWTFPAFSDNLITCLAAQNALSSEMAMRKRRNELLSGATAFRFVQQVPRSKVILRNHSKPGHRWLSNSSIH